MASSEGHWNATAITLLHMQVGHGVTEHQADLLIRNTGWECIGRRDPWGRGNAQ